MTGMEQMTLFDREMPQPLAARLRPRSGGIRGEDTFARKGKGAAPTDRE